MKSSLMMTLIAIATMIGNFAQAGSWSYGCVGDIPNGQRIIFNRDSLVVMAKAFEAGKLKKIDSDQMEIYQAVDNNSGLEKVMKFQYSSADPAQVILTQKDSKTESQTDQDMPCTGGRSREITHTTYKIKYEVAFPPQTPEHKPVNVELNCYEHIVTACG